LHYTAPMVKLRKQHEILNNPSTCRWCRWRWIKSWD
jgi:hypothetical protein